MKRPALLAALALSIACGAYAVAQDAPPAPAAVQPPPKAPPADGKGAPPHPHADGGPGMHRPDGDGAMRHMGMMGFESPVIGDLRELEDLYVQSGRAKELPALYNNVLARSQDPRVRTYVYHQLARAQTAPASVDQAIATLRKSLDENLTEEARRHDEMERMRARFEARGTGMVPPPAPAPAGK